MSLASLGVALALLALVAPGCGEPAAIDGHPCPCGDGYTCCGNVCVLGACGPDASTPLPTADPSEDCVADREATCKGRCGQLKDRCGMPVDCGGCAAGQVCGGGGQSVCGTSPCSPSCDGKACGESDGCGGLCEHGSCPAGLRCNYSVCVCDPLSCEGCCNGAACVEGNHPGACGHGGMTCEACYVGATCGKDCGVCGGKGQECCGADRCAAPLSCGGGGVAHVCGCTPTCVGKPCGAEDGCGGTCTYPSGVCPIGEFCTSYGRCECDEATCSGCCSADGCVAGSTDLSCGAQGLTCQSCASGAACKAGACNDGRARLLVYGGRMYGHPVTFTFDGKNWAPLSRNSAWCERQGMATLGASAVCFGGDKTWTFDGATWTQVAAGLVASEFRENVAMATLGQKVVLFGGDAYEVPAHGDTWVFDGASWREVAITGPSPRSEHAMATLGNVVVLFGGLSPRAVALDDTWTFDGAAWTKVNGPGPSARLRHAMATLGNRVFLFGGTTTFNSETLLRDTWSFDGATWTRLSFSVDAELPSAREFHGMATLGNQIVLFGGYDGDYANDTWLFDGSAWRSGPWSPGGSADVGMTLLP